MKKIVFLSGISFIFLFFSCSTSSNKGNSTSSAGEKAMSIALDYLKDRFKESKDTVTKDGIVLITDSHASFTSIKDNNIIYAINPSDIFTGQIDDDENTDAVMTVYSFKGQYREMPEILIFTTSDGELMLKGVVEKEMKILSVTDRAIIAEIPGMAPDSPNYDCAICKEVVRFRFINGELVKSD